MTTITKERIELFVKSPLENGLTRGEQMELARIALASLEAEPIGYMNRFTGRVFSLDEQPGADTDTAVYEPVYAAPPARDNKQTDELVMWVKRLAHSLRNARPNSKLHDAAMDYLSRKGLISVEDVLR
ncbi:Eaa protein [Salmonella enterica subsp. enterica serovar Newport]|nr:Eaa protein [Salmonella enterica subsp. enterica serovar Newport]